MFGFLKQALKTSIISLLANKVRSFLTMLGIIIGVAAVIIIMAVGAGAQSLILGQLDSLGSDLIGVMPGKSEEKGPPTSVMGIVITTLSYDDFLAIKNPQNVPNLVEAVAYNKGIGTVSYEGNVYDTNLSGSTAGYLSVEGGEVEEGRFFNEYEERNLNRVAVLGSLVKKELFGNDQAVGKRVRIKNHSFEVIGVMKERGMVAFQNYDDQIFLPLKTTQKLITGVDYLSLIRAKVDNKNNISIAIKDVERTLRIEHDIKDDSGKSDDFMVRSLAEALDMVTVITDALRYFLAAMAAISLLVGGIGIMNIMLINVNERTREIGLRKALGANNKNIINQFLLEAIMITVLGGFLGLILGTSIAFLIYLLASKGLGYDWVFLISLQSIVLSFSVSVAVGLIFGIYPAEKAGKMEITEALRYE